MISTRIAVASARMTQWMRLVLAVLSLFVVVGVAAAQDPEPDPESEPEPAAATPFPAQEQEIQPAPGVAPKPISAALLLGYGTDLGGDFNPWGFGIGLRGGYNIGRIYVGGRFTYHFGTSADLLTAGLSTIEVTYSLWDLDAEGGYDFPVGEKLTFRPSLLLGILHITASSDAPVFGGEAAVSSSNTKLVVSPGASLFYDITRDIFLGGDARLPWVVGGGSIFGLVIYVTGGLHF